MRPAGAPPGRQGWGLARAMKSRWSAAWLLLLALKAFGLKEGDPDISMGLQCSWILPGSVVNCSWSARDVNATHVLFYQSIKFRPDWIHQIQAQQNQSWLVLERSRLMLGDLYHVWLEVHGAAGTEVSAKLNVSLHEIVKPPAPHLDPAAVSPSGVTVSWENPYWSEHFADQPLVCELRYKTSREAAWTCLEVDRVSQEGHDLENLEPFASYEVQARCIPKDRQGFWSEWSLPLTFRTPEAAPLGQVDVWREVDRSEKSQPSLRLLWKPPPQEAARGIILKYTVDFLDRGETVVASWECPCCSVAVPAAASHARVSAHNSAGKTSPASLSLEETDLPAPQEVQVLVAQGLGFNVTWKFIPSPGGTQLKHYVVECREEVSSKLVDWTYSPVDSGDIQLRGDFRPREPYLVSVYAVYAEGSNSSAPVRAYFQEGVPSAGPQAVQDRSVSTTVSLVSWEAIPLAHQSGHLTHYTIYLKHPTAGSPEAYSHIGATERSYALKGLEPGTSYQLWMTGSTSAGEGNASPVHRFHTPGTRWQVYLGVLLSVGFLLILATVVVFLTRRWFLSLCHKVLPPWCWERIPDPGHSLVMVKMDAQGVALAKDTSCRTPAQTPEEPDILEITEPALPQTVLPSRGAFSDYEKHFMPSREELQRLA